MSFDDQIRHGLDAASRGHHVERPPTDVLVANAARRRQRRTAILAGGAAVLALVVGVTLAVVASGGGAPTAQVRAADQPTSANDANSPAVGSVDGAGSTTTTGAGGTASSTGPVASAGTAYAPPGSISHPSPTTTRATTPATTATSQPSSTGTVTVTQDDNGKTFTLHRGQHLVVSLSAPGWEWSEPDTDNAAVLQRVAVSANPASDQVTASFDAKTAGQAHVSAAKDAPCRKAQPPCMVPTYLWQITVNVV
jgi:hypothetical protein